MTGHRSVGHVAAFDETNVVVLWLGDRACPNVTSGATSCELLPYKVTTLEVASLWSRYRAARALIQQPAPHAGAVV
jgi:hypothetical protein